MIEIPPSEQPLRFATYKAAKASLDGNGDLGLPLYVKTKEGRFIPNPEYQSAPYEIRLIIVPRDTPHKGPKIKLPPPSQTPT